MPIDPNDAIKAIERSLGMIPGAAFVVILLAGPTVIWLLYRFVVQPRTSRYVAGDSPLLWVCADCRSVNEARLSRCYRCGLDREEITGALQVFDGDGLVTLESDDDWDEDLDATPGVGLPVAPLAVLATALGTRPVATTAVVPTAPPEPPPVVAAGPRRLVAVGPGRPKSGTTAPPAVPTPAATTSEPTPTLPPTSIGVPAKRRRAPVAAGRAGSSRSTGPGAEPPTEA